MIHNLGPIRLNPTGEFNQFKEYKFLDSVEYNGSTYVFINQEYITKTKSGVLPVDDPIEKSDLYWDVLALRGPQGPKADKYDQFITLTEDDHNVWDYSRSDKIIIPADTIFSKEALSIENVEDGCCGMIITRNRNIILPENSDYALDFDYVNVGVKQYYMYTFVYCRIMSSYRFIWNRTVIQGVEDLV